MANTYSEADKVAFKKKDLLYARQTAANVTSAIFEGKEIDSNIFIDYAGVVFDWLFQEQDKLDERNVPQIGNTSKPDVPTPSVEQKKVLDAIFNKLNLTFDGNSPCISEIEIQKKVLQYSTKVANVVNPTYPKSMASVDKIVNWINNNGGDQNG